MQDERKYRRRVDGPERSCLGMPEIPVSLSSLLTKMGRYHRLRDTPTLSVCRFFRFMRGFPAHKMAKYERVFGVFAGQ